MEHASAYQGRKIVWYWPIDPVVLIPVLDERGKVYGELTGRGRSTDNWPAEAWSIVSQDLGPAWAHINPDVIRIQANALRKKGKLRKTNPKAHWLPGDDSQRQLFNF